MSDFSNLVRIGHMMSGGQADHHQPLNPPPGSGSGDQEPQPDPERRRVRVVRRHPPVDRGEPDHIAVRDHYLAYS